MSYTPIAQILDLMDAELPKCPQALMLQAVGTALKEFFVETQAWTCELDRIKVKEDVRTYDLEQPAVARIDTIKHAWLDGRVLQPVSDYTMPTKSSIRLVHKPTEDTVDDAEEAGDDEDDGLLVEVVLRPWRTNACVVPADLYDEYQEGWAAGAKAILMDMDKTAWANPRMAAKHRVTFLQCKNAAKFDQERGGMNVELTARVSPGHEFE